MNHLPNHKCITHKEVREIVRVSDLDDSLEKMHKEVNNNKKLVRTKAQQIHNAQFNVVPFDFHVGK